MSKYIYCVRKKTCLDILNKRKIRDKTNKTNLKEGKGIEIETTRASIYAMHVLLSLLYLLT